MEVMYQLAQLIEGDLLAGKILAGGTAPPVAVVVFKLTWQGHDYLDSVRDPDIWQAETRDADRGGGQCRLRGRAGSRQSLNHEKAEAVVIQLVHAIPDVEPDPYSAVLPVARSIFYFLNSYIRLWPQDRENRTNLSIRRPSFPLDS
jgi:Hypothetical protein (DUF2513)